MGDAVVSFLLKDVSRRLTSEDIQEICLRWGIKDDILTIKHDFDLIDVVLHDAEEKRSTDKAVDLWLKRLRSATLMAENVLDDVSTEAKLERLHDRDMKYNVRAFFSSYHNQLMFRVSIAHKVKSLRKKLDGIAIKISELSLIPGDMSHVDVDVASVMPNRETCSLVQDYLLSAGRSAEVEMVAEKICNKDIGKYENGEIRVYGICGMGGVGKTTLARLVYNHERVKKYFELKCWVCVAKEFQVTQIIKALIDSIDGSMCTLTNLDVLQESLKSKLRQKRCLIVLDDVWEFEKRKWDLLSETLKCGAEGSIVLITTRSMNICQMMAKVPELQHTVVAEDLWLLFKKLAFAQGRVGDDISELKPIGRKIFNKCRGSSWEEETLEVKTLGSLMWSKRSTRDWQLVEDNNIWDIEETYILPALKLSYDNLLPHVKQCFTYCCLFPKGYLMERDVVIQLWVVNGFIPPKEETDMYMLGEDIFNYLVWRCFFQIVRDKKYSNDKYKMPDPMHDLALYVMGDDLLTINDGGKKVRIPNEVLHLRSCPDAQFSPKYFGKSSLRSIFLFGELNKVSISQNFNHTYLRVLYLCGIKLKTLPESICKLKHLRYLNLSYSSIEFLPESIVYLPNLQELLLNFCYELRKLPKDLRYMSSLRRLPRFHVGNNCGAKIGELGGLDCLEGDLEISGLENVVNFDEAESASLQRKRNLSILKLCWSNIYMKESEREMHDCDKEVLGRLKPNSNLRKLSIYFYMGKEINPSWMKNLTNLVEIGFSGCKRCKYIPQLGNLPNLRVIKLLGMDSLEGFHKEEKFFRLQELNILICQNLVSLPCDLPRLEILRLEECGALSYLPDKIFTSLTELEISGCKHLSQRYGKDEGRDWHRVSHIPNIRIHSPSYI